MADWRRTVQVLVKLLSSPGGHSSEARCIRVSTAMESVYFAFSVAVGLTSKRLPHMVRRFSQIDGDDVSGITGRA